MQSRTIYITDVLLFSAPNVFFLLRSELEITKEALKLEKERVEQYKAIASSAEEKLVEFTASYDAYREEMDKKLQEAEAMVANLERARNDLEERLRRTATEITELQEKLDMDRASFENEKAQLNSAIERSKAAERSVSCCYIAKEDIQFLLNLRFLH
jgi:chromosome segregation ATPase